MSTTESIWYKAFTLSELNSKMRNTLVAHLGIEFTEIGSDFLAATMPVDQRTLQPFKLLHGGANVCLAETLASVAANYTINQQEGCFVGQEINANHLRSVSSGIVTGIAKPIHLGWRSQVWEILISDQNQQLSCISRMTQFKKDIAIA